MNETINALDEATAVRILTAMAGARFRDDALERELTPEVRQALQASLAVAPAGGARVTDGDLARGALLILAADPSNHDSLAALVDNPPPQRFGIGTTVALTTAALLVLQTHIKFERSKDGKVQVKIEKQPTSVDLLKSLVAKLLSYL